MNIGIPQPSHYNKNQYPYNTYYNHVIHGNNPGNGSSQSSQASAHYFQNIRPPVDPIKFDTATTLGNTRSRVQDKTLGKIAGYGGLILDMFSGTVSAIGKLITLFGGGYEPAVDSRIQSTHVKGQVAQSSRGTQSAQNPAVSDAMLGKYAEMFNGLKLQLEKLTKQNEEASKLNKDLLTQNKELKDEIAKLKKAQTT